MDGRIPIRAIGKAKAKPDSVGPPAVQIMIDLRKVRRVRMLREEASKLILNTIKKESGQRRNSSRL